MGERIKELRKSLNLTQQAFADRLGIRQNTIAKYETQRGNPTTSVVALICREFNVNETWLRTGEGQMFNQVARENELTQFFNTLSTDDGNNHRRRLISVLARLNESQWELLEDMAFKLLEEFKKTSGVETGTLNSPDRIEAAPMPIASGYSAISSKPADDTSISSADIAARLAALERENEKTRLESEKTRLESERARLESEQVRRENEELRWRLEAIEEEDAKRDTEGIPFTKSMFYGDSGLSTMTQPNSDGKAKPK